MKGIFEVLMHALSVIFENLRDISNWIYLRQAQNYDFTRRTSESVLYGLINVDRCSSRHQGLADILQWALKRNLRKITHVFELPHSAFAATRSFWYRWCLILHSPTHTHSPFRLIIIWKKSARRSTFLLAKCKSVTKYNTFLKLPGRVGC